MLSEWRHKRFKLFASPAFTGISSDFVIKVSAFSDLLYMRREVHSLFPQENQYEFCVSLSLIVIVLKSSYWTNSRGRLTIFYAAISLPFCFCSRALHVLRSYQTSRTKCLLILTSFLISYHGKMQLGPFKRSPLYNCSTRIYYTPSVTLRWITNNSE